MFPVQIELLWQSLCPPEGAAPFEEGQATEPAIGRVAGLPTASWGTFLRAGCCAVRRAREENCERLDLSSRFGCRNNAHSFVLRPALMLTPSDTARRLEAPGPTAAVAVEVTTSFVQWGAVIA